MPLWAAVKKTKNHRSDPEYLNVAIKQSSGGVFNYQLLKSAKYQSCFPENTRGLTNCGMGRPSAKTNMNNYRMSFLHHDNFKVIDGAGNQQFYSKPSDNSKDLVYNLKSETRANGAHFQYGYFKHYIRSILAQDSSKKHTYASLNYNVSKDRTILTASNGETVHYNYFTKKIKHPMIRVYDELTYLESVEYSHGLNEYYTYEKCAMSQFLHIVEKKTGPSEFLSHALKIEYYGLGTIGDKVKYLKNSLGTTYEFAYFPDNQGGFTEVYDAERHFTKYKYSKDHRIEEITHFAGNAGPYTPVYSEVFTWNEEGRLTKKDEVEASGNTAKSLSFVYDKLGNITQEFLSGDLTGSSAYVTQSKTFTYSQDDFNNLILEEDSEGPSIEYHYLPGTDLCTIKYIICDGKITLRHFRFYNESNICWAEIFDNGAGRESDDLTEVTERIKIIRLISTEKNCFGKPTEESTFYLHNGADTLLKKLRYFYDTLGNLIKTEVLDADETLRYVLEKTYDAQNRLIWENDALGHTTAYSYDPFGNISTLSGPDKRYHIEITYDVLNRPIVTQQVNDDGTRQIVSQKFNLLNQVTEKTNAFNQTTINRYDDFGRLREQLGPVVVVGKQNGPLGLLQTILTYDIFGNPQSTSISDGSLIQERYTIRGQPSEKIYPDGTLEQWRYTLGGRLESYRNRDGVVTRYTYDRLGNIIQEEKIANDGQQAGITHFTWKGKRLLSTVDALGQIHSYTYDGAGRPIEESFGKTRISLTYDSLGRVFEQTTWENDEPLSIVQSEYDLLDRVISQKTFSADRTLQRRVDTNYDVCGREVNSILWTSTDECMANFTYYDTLGRPYKIVDFSGRTTHITYQQEKDPHNAGSLLVKITTDPMGRITTEKHDPMDRVISIETKNPFGDILSSRTFAYDVIGRRTECIENNTQRYQWVYNSNGDLIEEISAAETFEQKIVLHSYSNGHKIATLKPDGNTITWNYDHLGRIHIVSDTQKTLAYQYTYDPLDRPIVIEDTLHNTNQRYSYSSEGTLKEEYLDENLRLGYEYDSLNQLKILQYPDGSSSRYHYQGIHLQNVVRLNTKGQEKYSHQVDQRNLVGRPIKTTLPGNAGTLQYAYNNDGLITTIISNFFQQTIADFDSEGNPCHIKTKDIKDIWDDQFNYDSNSNLIQEKGQKEISYTYDSIGNRTQNNGNKWTYNVHNQLISTSEQTFTYDLNGNLLSDGNINYSYDGFDRLIGIEKDNEKITYTYDTYHRRLRKITSQGETKYLYAAKDEIGSHDGQNSQLRILADGLGAEIGASIAIELNEKVYVPIHDQRGSIRTLLDLEGDVQAVYRYSAFGEMTYSEGVGSPWTFCGKRTDPETQFIYFGNRYYDPKIGRWTTLDPIGFTPGAHGYNYLKNSPFSRIDIYGNIDCDFQYHPKITHDHVWEEYWKDFWLDDDLCFENFYDMSSCCDLSEQGLPNLPKDMRIGFINGIWNGSKGSKECAEYVSKLSGGYNIDYVYNATHGDKDIPECILGLFYIATEPVRQLKNMWNNFFEKSSANAKYLMICHSQGAIHVRNALLDYPPELRERILVVAIAPAAYIYQDTCAKVVHYRAEWWRDFVPRFDRAGARREKDTIFNLASHPSAAFFDHDFMSPTYHMILKENIQYYIKTNGQML